MMDFEAARTKMVDNQVRTTDVTSHSVLKAFYAIPREAFVPAKAKSLAYIDTDIEVAPGRYLMEASPLAKLLQLAAITGNDAVLEIGTGSGYATAILCSLAGSVVSVEVDETLAAQAKETLAAQGCANVSVVTGALVDGHVAEGPYDLIFVNGSIEEVPAALLDQLQNGGRLVAVVGYGNAAQAKVLVRDQGFVSESVYFNASVKPLPGFAKAREFVF